MAFKALITGLGNPGPKYERTRHNYGFMAVDALLSDAADRGDAPKRLLGADKRFELFSLPLFGTRGRLPGTFLAAKPMTYMNLSGEAVGRICSYYDIAPDAVVALHDDLDLPLGRVKIKLGGGDAGHKGLASITRRLGTPNYCRVRLGIGRPAPGRDVKGFVLQKFSGGELRIVKEVVAKALAGALLYLEYGLDEAMRGTNGFDAAPPDADVI